MLNREWLNSLSNRELAEKLDGLSCNFCIYRKRNGDCEKPIDKNCLDDIEAWLGKKHVELMPEIKEGDFVYYLRNGESRLGICVCTNIVYLIDKNVCTSFEGEIKQKTIGIRRYTHKKGMVDIWRSDND